MGLGITLRNVLVIVATLGISLGLGEALFVTVPANGYVCFHESLKQDERLGITFSVSEGGFLDIDFDVFDPDNTPNILSSVKVKDRLRLWLTKRANTCSVLGTKCLQ